MTMFDKLRDRTEKRYVKKYQVPFGTLNPDENYIGGYYKSVVTGQILNVNTPIGVTRPSATLTVGAGDTTDLKAVAGGFVKAATNQDTSNLEGDAVKGAAMASNMEDNAKAHTDRLEQQQQPPTKVTEEGGKDTLGKGAQIASAAFQVADQMMMGDKNFGAQSEAIDTAVHGVSGALMKSGNPYAMIAGAALEGANFLTKAGGQTVQGFDVDIKSSGYDSNMGHMESSSSRDFGALIGLGGLFGQGKMKEKLAKRNAQAKMAMNAANIAEDQAFEQEARANSIQNTIMNNNIALAGGLNTSLLGG